MSLGRGRSGSPKISPPAPWAGSTLHLFMSIPADSSAAGVDRESAWPAPTPREIGAERVCLSSPLHLVPNLNVIGLSSVLTSAKKPWAGTGRNHPSTISSPRQDLSVDESRFGARAPPSPPLLMSSAYGRLVRRFEDVSRFHAVADGEYLVVPFCGEGLVQCVAGSGPTANDDMLDAEQLGESAHDAG